MTEVERKQLEDAFEPKVSDLVESVFSTSDKRKLRLATFCGVAESREFFSCTFYSPTCFDSCLYLAEFGLCTCRKEESPSG